MPLVDLTSSDAVLAALAECDALGRDAFLKQYGYKYSRLYPLKYNGRVYDSKAIADVAYGKQHGTALRARDFSGGLATVVPLLKRLGFDAEVAPHPLTRLEIGATYERKMLINLYGGQLRNGIWTPKEFPVVLLFSGKSGEQYGYKDHWTSDGVFRYTGEGQRGDMTFVKGNKAVRDHRSAKRDLLLFQDIGKGKGVRFTGVFECMSWSIEPGKSKHVASRKLIVFDLWHKAGWTRCCVNSWRAPVPLDDAGRDVEDYSKQDILPCTRLEVDSIICTRPKRSSLSFSGSGKSIVPSRWRVGRVVSSANW